MKVIIMSSKQFLAEIGDPPDENKIKLIKQCVHKVELGIDAKKDQEKKPVLVLTVFAKQKKEPGPLLGEKLQKLDLDAYCEILSEPSIGASSRESWFRKLQETLNYSYPPDSLPRGFITLKPSDSLSGLLKKIVADKTKPSDWAGAPVKLEEYPIGSDQKHQDSPKGKEDSLPPPLEIASRWDSNPKQRPSSSPSLWERLCCCFKRPSSSLSSSKTKPLSSAELSSRPLGSFGLSIEVSDSTLADHEQTRLEPFQ